MNKIIFLIISIFFSFPAYADMSNDNKTKAWDCSGIYLSNYFLPIGDQTFEYSMKEKSMSSAKVLREYALEIGISEKEWAQGVNKAADKHYGSKFDEAKTEECHAFLEALIPNGKERVNKVVLY